jgi:hypothetical protein
LVPVTDELTSRVFSKPIHRYGKNTATSKKLLIKIHSTIEASEMCTIWNS